MFVRVFSTIFLFLLLDPSGLNAQNSSEKLSLQKEKKTLQKKIIEARRILDDTKTKQRASVGELSALQNLITINRKYSGAIEKELIVVKDEAAKVRLCIVSLNNNLISLKKEYSEMLYSAQKAINSREQLLFLFSSDDYNQLNLRIKYLEMVREVRKRQLEKIKSVKHKQETAQLLLNKTTLLKEEAIKDYEVENKRLDSLGKENLQLISVLKSQEEELKNGLSKYRRRQIKVDKLINDIIKAEIDRKRKLEAAKKKELERLANLGNRNFEKNKGYLSWPVKQSFISQKFGPQNHPTIPGIKVNNPGVGLQTQKGARVRAVYSGKVMTIASIPGSGKLIMIAHGDYYTVYSKLKMASVSKGESVEMNQIIGSVMTDANGVTELGFQVWKDTDKENPELWLKK